MLFEPQTRTLIAGDALWEDRLAIIFPELEGLDGFSAATHTLDLIETLAPRTVIPGHGSIFHDVETALEASRKRIAAFSKDPSRHVRHAARALLMFHIMEIQSSDQVTLLKWLAATPIFIRMAKALGRDAGTAIWASELLESLLDDGLLGLHQGALSLSASSSR
jgi:glyoxylase-like metal-dependent hydrolase (beta-lactamase superfamily II)